MKRGLVALAVSISVFISGQAEGRDLTRTGTVFNDVNSGNYFCGWIEWFNDLEVTTECSTTSLCMVRTVRGKISFVS